MNLSRQIMALRCLGKARQLRAGCAIYFQKLTSNCGSWIRMYSHLPRYDVALLNAGIVKCTLSTPSRPRATRRPCSKLHLDHASRDSPPCSFRNKTPSRWPPTCQTIASAVLTWLSNPPGDRPFGVLSTPFFFLLPHLPSLVSLCSSFCLVQSASGCRRLSIPLSRRPRIWSDLLSCSAKLTRR